LEQLKLYTIRIREHRKGPCAAGRKARSLKVSSYTGAIVAFGKRAVVADGWRPCPGGADGDVSDLSILRKIPEKYEVADCSPGCLLVKLRSEDARVDLGRGSGVRHDDIEMFEAQILERKCRPRLRLGCASSPASRASLTSLTSRISGPSILG
jgi:hypothetical protein